MSTRERLNKLRSEIDELLNEVEKTTEFKVVLERIQQLETKMDKIDEIEERLKSRTATETVVETENILGKIGDLDSKIMGIREDISILKKEVKEEIKSLRAQVANIIEAIIDLVKTVAPEIVKPETGPLTKTQEKIPEEKPLPETWEHQQPLLEKPEEATLTEKVPQTAEMIEIESPPVEQPRESPTFLTRLKEEEFPEKIEEAPTKKEFAEFSEAEGLSVKEGLEKPESDLDSLLTEEDKKLLRNLGLDMLDYIKEKKVKLSSEDRAPAYVQLTNLETKKLKLEREIIDLKTMIKAGFGSLEDEKRLNDKIREKEEIEKQIRDIESSL